MALPYEHTPVIWPLLAASAGLTTLGIYALRRRAVPGAVPFVVLAGILVLWSLASALKLASTVDETRIFWFKFETALLLPAVSAALCFALEYAGLGKWLTRKTLILLAVPPLVFAILIFTNGIHNRVWTRIWFDGYVRTESGPVRWSILAYAYFLSLLNLMVLAWLFIRSPRHRWIAGALILTPFIMRAFYVFRFVDWNPFEPLDPMVVAVIFGVSLYTLAFFRFHIFDVVPVARDTVIEKMPQGMMVLNSENRIVDINETAQTQLGIIRSKVLGRTVTEALNARPGLLRIVLDSSVTQEEISLGDSNARWFQVALSPVMDRRGFHLGRVVWFRDVTTQRRTQKELLDQQRTLAMLEERELLGRELHDGIGQMLAAVQMQARSASELLRRGESVKVEDCLRRIADVAQEAKESVRTYLSGVKSRSQEEQGFLSTLRRLLKGYRQDYGFVAELTVPPEMEGKRIGAAVEAQLLPIIQEALTNVRRARRSRFGAGWSSTSRKGT